MFARTFFAVLVASSVAAQETTVVECQRTPTLVVRLRVAASASLADRGWLQLEFENRTAGPLRLANVHWRFDQQQALDAKTGELCHSGSLASGNTFDLFGEAAKGGASIPPGVTRVAAPLSDYSAALLGEPPANGWRVRATAHVRVLGDGEALDVVPGVPFEFLWLPADDAGVERMRVTVRELLAREAMPIASVYYTQALLKQPRVAAAVSLDGLLALRNRRERHWSTWDHVVRQHLGNAYADDEALLAWVRALLVSDDRHATVDLQHMPHLWHASFLEPLLRRYEAGDRAVPWILFQRGSPHRSDPVAQQRLAAPLRATLRGTTPALVARLDGDARRRTVSTLAATMRDLGWSGDAAAVEDLAPWLDCKLDTEARGPTPWPAFAVNRLCDIAYEAILSLRREDAPPETASAPVHELDLRLVLPRSREERDAVHDRRIEALKLRLAAPK